MINIQNFCGKSIRHILKQSCSFQKQSFPAFKFNSQVCLSKKYISSKVFTKEILQLSSVQSDYLRRYCSAKRNSDLEMNDGSCGNKMLTVTYEDVVNAQTDNSFTTIDVREHSEIKKTGKLPGSIHIPMGEVQNVLTKLSPQEFQQKFKRKKPTKESNIIVSCAAGKRSAMVQNELQKIGYSKVHNYTGGWSDWENHQKG